MSVTFWLQSGSAAFTAPLERDMEWRRCIGCLKLQISFRKKITNFRALFRKMTYKDKISYDSTPPCAPFVILRLGAFTDPEQEGGRNSEHHNRVGVDRRMSNFHAKESCGISVRHTNCTNNFFLHVHVVDMTRPARCLTHIRDDAHIKILLCGHQFISDSVVCGQQFVCSGSISSVQLASEWVG